MNTLVLYSSKSGNTQLLAEEVSRAIAQVNGIARDVFLPAYDELDPAHLQAANLVLRGSPTHRMNVPKIVRSIFDRLPRKIRRGRSVASFNTSYKMADRGLPVWLARFTAAPRLLRKLRKLGGKPVAPPETFFVEDREGPLYEGELVRARSWAVSLLTSLHVNLSSLEEMGTNP